MPDDFSIARSAAMALAALAAAWWAHAEWPVTPARRHPPPFFAALALGASGTLAVALFFGLTFAQVFGLLDARPRAALALPPAAAMAAGFLYLCRWEAAVGVLPPTKE